MANHLSVEEQTGQHGRNADAQSTVVISEEKDASESGNPQEARAETMDLDPLRRELGKTLFASVVALNEILRIASRKIQALATSKSVENASTQGRVANSASADTPVLQSAGEPIRTEIHDRRSGNAQNEPEVFRTVIAQRGGPLNPAKHYVRMTEEVYDSVEENDLASAFEMRKEVRTIQPPSDANGKTTLGVAVLENDIVESVTSETIIIRSHLLLKAIKDTVYWPSAAFYDGQKSLQLNSPYRSIGVYRNELEDLLDLRKKQLSSRNPQNQENQDNTDTTQHNEQSSEDSGLSFADLELTVRHLELFLRAVDKSQSQGIEMEKGRHKRNMATFDKLWMLFKPGMVVFSEKDGVTLAFRVKLLIWRHASVTNSGPNDPFQSVEVRLWYLDHNGTHINRRSHSVSIDRYHGEKSISQLPVFPELFSSSGEEIREKRIERGRKYVSLIQNHYSLRQYRGKICDGNENPHDTQYHRTYHGQVIVDPEQHYQEHGWSKGVEWLDESDVQENKIGTSLRDFIKLSPVKQLKDTSEESPTPFGEDQLFLLPEWIRGFTIAIHGDRKWVWLHVDDIHNYTPDRDLITTLALPEKNIDLLKAMTYLPNEYKDGYNDDRLWSPENIANKGTGRIIILHGVPGVGKTYTAECIAAWSGRPLVRLTCAELGIEPSQIEKTLNSYLRRAERWNAIVLMDEADVYMSKRLEHNYIQATAITSVFLRALEYYSGIIFITTNRIHVIDRAILNRALLVMEYKQLTNNQRGTIAGHCLARLDSPSGMPITVGAKKLFLDELTESDHDWDGREIVQALTLAVRLADFQNCEKKHKGKAQIVEEHIENAFRVLHGHSVLHKRMNDTKSDKPALKSTGYDADKIG